MVDEVAHAALGEALLGHVHGVDEHRGVALAGAVDQRHVHRDAQAAPVGGQQVRVAAEGRLVAPDERRDERAAGGRLVGGHDPGGGQPGHLLAGAAEHRRERVVDAHVAAVAVQQRHADRRVVERVGEALLALRRLALRAAGLAGEPGERDGHEGAEQAADDEGDHAPAQMRRRGRRGAQVPLLPRDGDGPAVGVPGEPAVPADAGRALAQLERGAVREHAGHRADELGEAERADRRAAERAVGGPHRRVDEDARDVGADEAADGGGLRRVERGRGAQRPAARRVGGGVDAERGRRGRGLLDVPGGVVARAHAGGDHAAVGRQLLDRVAAGVLEARAVGPVDVLDPGEGGGAAVAQHRAGEGRELRLGHAVGRLEQGGDLVRRRDEAVELAHERPQRDAAHVGALAPVLAGVVGEADRRRDGGDGQEDQTHDDCDDPRHVHDPIGRHVSRSL